MSRRYPPVHYHEYLKIDQLITAQKPMSHEYQQPAHDEHLFIIVHQVYELWFKQILTEVDSVMAILQETHIPEKLIGVMVQRIHRVGRIIELLIDQVPILETMTPLDFLDFRDMLFPASGFQSFQFRMLEAKLGLRSSQRLKFNSQPYTAALTSEQATVMQKIESQPNLTDLIERWLSRTPFLKHANFDFWQAYKNAVEIMLQRDRDIVNENSHLGDEDRKRNFQIISDIQNSFDTLFDENRFEEARAKGTWRFSFKAVHSALFIQVYRDQPILQQPFQLLTGLINLDELLTNWRYRHSLLAKRMLGTKIGTGGSSGAEYLRASTEQHRLFSDLNQLTTFFIPRSHLPPLPENVIRELNFVYSGKD